METVVYGCENAHHIHLSMGHCSSPTVSHKVTCRSLASEKHKLPIQYFINAFKHCYTTKQKHLYKQPLHVCHSDAW